MPKPSDTVSAIDRVVHEPARLAILTALSSCRSADFLFLLTLTGFTKGNLSAHLGKLEEAGLVRITKEFVDKTPRTSAMITPEGRKALDSYWDQMQQLRRAFKHAHVPSDR